MEPIASLRQLAGAVEGLLKTFLNAYAQRDALVARQVIEDDSGIDVLHTGLFREILTYMLEDP